MSAANASSRVLLVPRMRDTFVTRAWA